MILMEIGGFGLVTLKQSMCQFLVHFTNIFIPIQILLVDKVCSFRVLGLSVMIVACS